MWASSGEGKQLRDHCQWITCIPPIDHMHHCLIITVASDGTPILCWQGEYEGTPWQLWRLSLEHCQGSTVTGSSNKPHEPDASLQNSASGDSARTFQSVDTPFHSDKNRCHHSTSALNSLLRRKSSEPLLPLFSSSCILRTND